MLISSADAESDLEPIGRKRAAGADMRNGAEAFLRAHECERRNLDANLKRRLQVMLDRHVREQPHAGIQHVDERPQRALHTRHASRERGIKKRR